MKYASLVVAAVASATFAAIANASALRAEVESSHHHKPSHAPTPIPTTEGESVKWCRHGSGKDLCTKKEHTWMMKDGQTKWPTTIFSFKERGFKTQDDCVNRCIQDLNDCKHGTGIFKHPGAKDTCGKGAYGNRKFYMNCWLGHMWKKKVASTTDCYDVRPN